MSAQVELTELEKDVLINLTSAWNKYHELEQQHPSDPHEFAESINRCQQLIALRVARRVNPGAWYVTGT